MGLGMWELVPVLNDLQEPQKLHGIRNAGVVLSLLARQLRVWGLGFGVWGLGFRVQGSGFRVQGSGFRVQGLGFRV